MKKSKLIYIILSAMVLISLIIWFFFASPTTSFSIQETCDKTQVEEEVKQLFNIRNKAILTKDLEAIDYIYDKNSKYGNWAYEHELKKMKYLYNWSEKQGVKFIDIAPMVLVRKIKGSDEHCSVNLICSTEYKYVYENNSDNINMFRIGTAHSLNLIKKNGIWIISKEWYTDPFADSLNLENIKASDIKNHIITQSSRDFSTLNERRNSALSYADKYCGIAADEENGFKYNRKYGDYNPLGGDCANFASQILHEGGKFKKTSSWNFDSKGGSRAWLNANAFKDYMIGSGRASLIAYGNYDKVYKASYKLLPGDFVAYEKKGKVVHVSVVTGADSKGYSLVNCHNTDRYRVPWDLGWSDKKIKFWLVRVHY
ncbi:amidase domain-containing protein [Clostridium brassicae]|uniref:Amidase domain-containing protein n=1 Tax=Clostridium brassicae TaxID=2999072 RepID=A0ABT4DEF4_9CLOT|nr:amidase domain-containing protein [Clostridium brassicae]MCY6959389.1 amidase domain-containing protein [Clostridium brassicae]